ncbi:hypothetical protein [Naasia sp. SYSU D00948]|uniref:hypothetical protein n=1 Tax=Naasia sp. SYSU D00948 TaxID=2817379 RepID=UPI001B30A4F5|nr:hypothetical protein [Naasia sp. SYSU D00948]
MPNSPEPIRDDSVRLVAAVAARGPESELAREIAESAIETHSPTELAVDVADIAATSLEALATSEGEDKETLLQELTDRRQRVE